MVNYPAKIREFGGIPGEPLSKVELEKELSQFEGSTFPDDFQSFYLSCNGVKKSFGEGAWNFWKVKDFKISDQSEHGLVFFGDALVDAPQYAICCKKDDPFFGYVFEMTYNTEPLCEISDFLTKVFENPDDVILA